MNKIIFFIIVFSAAIFSQELNYTFSELRGLEDNNGNTHLFYRLYGSKGVPLYAEHSIYHFDIEADKDSLFIFAGGDFTGSDYLNITDLEFWNNNPSRFIYCGYKNPSDLKGFVKIYNQENAQYFDQPVDYIEISKQNDSLIFFSGLGIHKSTNRGNTWEKISDYFILISVSPLNDSIIFSYDYSGNLNKSYNRSESYSIVDTGLGLNMGSWNEMYMDKNYNYLYLLSHNTTSFLSVSNNNGEPNSWTKKYNTENKLSISVDTSHSGHIYLAEGNTIYLSTDYGETFNLFKEFDKRIVGIYKKPNSDILYAATDYDLFEITSDSIKTLKHITINYSLVWYPLEIGNKWFYDNILERYITQFSIEVVRDTIINEKNYYKLAHTENGITDYYFERVDTLSPKVYRLISGEEVELYDFSIGQVGDTVLFDNGGENRIGWFLTNREPFDQFGIISFKSDYEMLLSASGYQSYSFVGYLGFYQSIGGEELQSITTLKGFIKNGVAYGDTTIIVGVDKYEENLPAKFSLLQNYPNPFNPTTKIKYSIPTMDSPFSGGTKGGLVHVLLKVYDILGRETVTLVNEEKPAGEFEVEFDAGNLSSGIYFYKLQTENYSTTKKMILLR